MIANFNLNENSYTRTVFGTPISDKDSQLVRFYRMERDATWKKCAAVALSAFIVLSATFLYGSMTLGLNYFFLEYENFMSIDVLSIILQYVPKIIRIFVAAMSVFICGKNIYDFARQLSFENAIQTEHDVIVNALGGLQALNEFPVATLNDDTHFHNEVTPEMINNYRISRGIDLSRRPFVAFCVENVADQDQKQVIVLHATAGDMSWTLTGREQTIMLHANNDHFFNTIRALVQGQEVNEYRLIPAV